MTLDVKNSLTNLVEGYPIAAYREGRDQDQHETKDRQLRRKLRKIGALEHQPTDDAQEMGDRNAFANRLRPARHAAEGKGESRQEDRRQQEEERHLHSLQLVLGDGRKGEAD